MASNLCFEYHPRWSDLVPLLVSGEPSKVSDAVRQLEDKERALENFLKLRVCDAVSSGAASKVYDTSLGSIVVTTGTTVISSSGLNIPHPGPNYGILIFITGTAGGYGTATHIAGVAQAYISPDALSLSGTTGWDITNTIDEVGDNTKFPWAISTWVSSNDIDDDFIIKLKTDVNVASDDTILRQVHIMAVVTPIVVTPIL